MTTDITRPSHDIRRVAGIGIGIIVVTFGVIGLWAAFAPLSSAVVGNGSVALESNRQTITHYDGGIIRALLVHDGDHVKAGQTLLELNPIQADASVGSARNQLFSLLTRLDRLAAERDSRPAVRFSPEVMAQSTNPVVANAMVDEQRQFTERRGSVLAQVAVLQTRIAESRNAVQGIDEQILGTKSQASILDEELSALDELYQKNLVPKPRILDLQRARAQLQGQLGGLMAEKARTEKSIGETQLQIAAVHQQFSEQISRETSEAQTQANDIRQRFAVAQDIQRRVTIAAPVDGVVQNLRVFTVGGVIRPAEPLMDIAPDHGRMVVRATFSPNDVDSVHAGQIVQVRFATFHSRTIPVIDGTVRSVSQDRLTDEATHMPYYMVMVDVPDQNLPAEIKGKLRAGLPTQVIAPTGTRTALQYTFGPLTSAMATTMRER